MVVIYTKAILAMIAGVLVVIAPARITSAQSPIPFERNIDRPGNDYLRLDASSADDCERNCRNDPRCRAFTFVLPETLQGPQGQCWLKDNVPPTRPSNCYVSGVKR